MRGTLMWWVCWCTQEAEAGEGDEMFTEQYADAETGTLIRPRIRTHTHACRCFTHVFALLYASMCTHVAAPIDPSFVEHNPRLLRVLLFPPTVCRVRCNESRTFKLFLCLHHIYCVFYVCFLIFCCFGLCVRAVAWQET